MWPKLKKPTNSGKKRGRSGSCGKTALTVWLAVMLACVCTAHETKTKYGKTIPVGTQMDNAGGHCLIFRATVTAGDFFQGLERTDTSNGPLFSRKGKPLENFQNNILLEIEMVEMLCRDPSKSEPPDAVDSRFPIEFEIRHNQDKPSIVPQQEIKIVTGLPLIDLGSVLRQTRHYSFEIAANGLPLTDYFAVTVLSAGGTQIARFKICLCK